MGHIPPISMNVQTTLSAYRIVTQATDEANCAIYPSAATVRPLGVTSDTVLDTTAAIPVIISGVARVEFNAAVTAGSFVAANSSGQGVGHTDTTAGSYIVGVLLEPLVTVTGTIGRVLVQPHFKSIP